MTKCTYTVWRLYLVEAAGQGAKPPGVTDWREYVAKEFYRPPDEAPASAKLRDASIPVPTNIL